MTKKNNIKAFEDLSTQVRRTFHRLKAVGDEVHELGRLSTSHRAVLESLYRTGPQTVPELARSRPVSRQHIQKLVNALLDEKLVTTQPNPAHKTSLLVDLNPKGRALFEQMRKKEQELLADLKLPVTENDLRQAAETLNTLCDYFEGSDWLAAKTKFKSR